MSGMRIEVFTSVVLAVLTGVYVVLTYWMLKTNQRQLAVLREEFESSVRPHINIETFTFPGSQLFKLRIRNIGKSAAEHLRLQIDRDFWSLGRADRNLRDFHIFNQVIDSFSPGQELVFNLGISHEILRGDFEGKCPTRFSISAEYRYLDKPIRETILIDLNPFAEAATITDPVHEQLSKIGSALEEIANSLPLQHT